MATSLSSTAPNPANLPWNSSSGVQENAAYDCGPFGLTYGSFNNTDRSLAIELGRQTPTCTAPPCTSDILDYLNDGTGNLTLRSKTQMFGSFLVTVDVNGDLITDIVGLNRGHFDGNMQYVLGDGHGIFSAAHQLAAPDTGVEVLARDMNLDGRHDFVIPEEPGDVLLEINNNATVTCAPPGSGSLHAKFCAPRQTQPCLSPSL